MTHMIDITTGRAAIAYRNEVPWHGLGQKIPEGCNDLKVWQQQGGIDYAVKRSVVQFQPLDPDTARGESNRITVPSRHVLYRSDTWRPLGVVGAKYRIVQPAQIMETFRDLIEISGFQMETVGALSDGARIWALARVGKEAAIIGKDIVKRYLLVATSYDTSMSTIAKFVDERVVCHNTITAALGEDGKQIRIHHGKDFKPDEIKKELGIGVATWDKYVHNMRALAQQEITYEQAANTTARLLAWDHEQEEQDKARETKGFKRIMALFDKGIGTELTEGPSAWRWLNAVTQYVDWEKGVTASSRMNSAWFGEGDQLKSRALQLVTS